MNKKVIWGIVIVILIAILAYAVVVKTSTANWVTYDGQENIINFKHPATWEVESVSDSEIIVFNASEVKKPATDTRKEGVTVKFDQLECRATNGWNDLSYGYDSYKTVCIKESSGRMREINMVAFSSEAKRIEDKILSSIATTEQSRGSTSDWKTYKNEKYGFEFKYPKEFSIYSDASTTKTYSIVFISPNIPETEVPLPRIEVAIDQKLPDVKIGTKRGSNDAVGDGESILIDIINISKFPEIIEYVWQFEPDAKGSDYRVINRKEDTTDYFDLNGFGNEVASTFKFTTPKNTTIQPSITVLSPNGGESFVRNVEIPVSWLQNSNFAVNICILSKSGGCVYTSASINAISGQNNFVIPSDAYKFICASSCYLDSGYRIKITTDSPPGTPGEFLSDSSDTYFTITNYIAN